MARKYLDKQDLISKVDTAIKEHEELKGYYFNGLYTVRGFDGNGCNWSMSFLATQKENTTEHGSQVKSIIKEHQDTYNIFTGN